MATVASMNGAPMIAPMATSSPSAPASTATMGIVDSGSAVPTAASRLPTAPWPRFRRCPSHSTELVNSTAPTTMSTNDRASRSAVIPAGVPATRASYSDAP